MSTVTSTGVTWLTLVAVAGCVQTSGKDSATHGCQPSTEIPYDGVDQDCDGADLTDVDGDGYTATEAGGDDCNDQAAQAHPGGGEERGNGVDEDCDGRIDEYIVCADGLGDFTTVQDGIDGVPDGSTLELCAGVYREDVTIYNRKIDIEGGSADPEDVKIMNNGNRTDSNGIIVDIDGENSEVELRWISIESNDREPRIGVFVHDARSLVVDRVTMCDRTGYLIYKVEVENSVAPNTELSITRSRFCTNQGQTSGSGVISTGMINGGTVLFAGNLLNSDGADDLGRTEYGFGFEGRESAVLENNLFSNNGGVGITHAGHIVATSVTVRNNTFVDIGEISIGGYTDGVAAEGEQIVPRFDIYDNIYSNVGSVSTIPLWSATWAVPHEPSPDDAFDVLPNRFDANLVWNVRCDPFAEVVLLNGVTGGPYELRVDVSDQLASGRVDLDPMFAGAGAQGSYGVSGASPAVDNGIGEPDPDGSPNDIGAFGGPGGNWFTEVPWRLP